MSTTRVQKVTIGSLARFIGFYSGLWVPLLFVALAFPLAWPPVACLAEAQTVPTDFCYRIPITVTNNTGGPVSDQSVRMIINSSGLVTGAFMEDSAWDLRPVDPALAPREVLAQDLTSALAPWWATVDGIIANGGSSTFSMYLGHATAKRNQGFEFTGSDSITVTDHPDLQITDRLGLVVTVQADDPEQDATLIDKHTGSSGYRLLLFDDSGTAKVRGQINGVTFDVPSSGAFSGDETTIRMEFLAPDLEIFFDDVSQGTTDTGEVSISTNSEPVLMGTGFTGILREAEIRSGVGSSPARVARWGFHPQNTSESTAVNPTYTGVVSDEITTHDGVYSLTRDQTNIDVSVGAVALTFTNAALTAQERFVNILGPVVTVDPFTLQTPIASNLPFFSAFDAARTAVGLTEEAFWVGIIGFFSGAVAFVVYVKSRRYDITAAIPGVGFLLGAVIGLIQPWVVIVYGFTAAGLWLLARWMQ